MEDLNLGLKMDKQIGDRLKLNPGQIRSMEEDINRLFEAIDIRTSRKDGRRKSSMKRPIRPGSSQASEIGFSGSVTLKQALRGLCISHASEMAATKRLSKPEEGSSRVLETGTLKGLHRAAAVEAGECGLFPKATTTNFSEKTFESGTKVELLNRNSHSSTVLVDAPTRKAKMTKIRPEDEIVPLPTSGGYEISMGNLGNNGKPILTHSSSNGDNNASNDVIESASSGQRIMRPVSRNKNFVMKKVK